MEASKAIVRPDGIVVVGDVMTDYLLHSFQPLKRSLANSNWEQYSRAEINGQPGGALLISDLLTDSLPRGSVTSYSSKGATSLLQSFVNVRQFAFSRTEDDSKVYRVEKFTGFKGGESSITCSQLPSDAELLLISDAGNSFRHKPTFWSDIVRNASGLVILKMAAPVASGGLWTELLKQHVDRLMAVVNADDLRDAGVHLSRGISWERTALDFVRQLLPEQRNSKFQNSQLSELKKCQHLLVRFGLEAVLYYRNQGTNKSVSLYYDPVRTEGEYGEEYDGKMFGFGAVFCASLAIDYAGARNAADCADLGNSEPVVFKRWSDLDLPRFIRNGLVASRRLLRFGFGGDPSNLKIQHDEVFSRSAASRQFAISSIPLQATEQMLDARSWSFLKQSSGVGLVGLAEQIVRFGKLPPNFGAPIARFGDLQTMDRSEIESYRSIRNLLWEFLAATDVSRPLSIAVFGQPGSGKSFGITEVANSLNPNLVKSGLVFNVSQFTSAKDLTDAFHAIRDISLQRKVPLVFFDEFDASFQGALAWLKYFLAPMQDGKFKDGEAMHPIGKAIFVFAGGTSTTFQQFQDQVESKKTIWTADEKKATKVAIREVKGQMLADAKLPDFVSRLRGHINIVGPNPVGADDNQSVIRRAVVLRSLFLRKCQHLIQNNEAQISSDVLKAFLNTTKYRHGVRSMESIVDMSMLAGQRKFERSALPTHDQLDMHVIADDFLDCLSR